MALQTTPGYLDFTHVLLSHGFPLRSSYGGHVAGYVGAQAFPMKAGVCGEPYFGRMCRLPTAGQLSSSINQLIVVSEMIKNFSDHSANERTFLAWVRTAIGVMAFGFLIEKFDLFVRVAAPSAAQHYSLLPSHELGSIAGLMFVVLGLAMIVLAAARFALNAKSIDRTEQVPGTGSRIDLALALLLVLLGCSMFLYLAFSL